MMTDETTKHTDLQLSIVMVVHDEGTVLAQNLPVFLTQSCDTLYEVIVVDDASTDDTPDILKSLKEHHPHLHTTFLPQSVPNPSRMQLALYVGVKATHSDCIVIADIHRPPTSSAWIDGLAQEMSNDNTELAMVYSDRKRTEDVTFQSFEQLEDAQILLLKAERRTGKGHQGSRLKRKRGIYDAIAVCKTRIFDAIRLYDHSVKGGKLLKLRLLTFWKNITF